MSRGYFITGTDTGVGKTLVSCALLHAFAIQGQSVVGMKPVAAGCENGKWQDVELLAAASTVTASREYVNPYAFAPAIAPHIAARMAGIYIDIGVIRKAYTHLQQRADKVIVEGVGGFFVPLNHGQHAGDMAAALGLPVIMVVGMRLGCLNHALLTANAVQAAGLALAGWVANCIDPEMPVFDENVQALEQRLPSPLLGVLPFQQGPHPWEFSRLLDIAEIYPE